MKRIVLLLWICLTVTHLMAVEPTGTLPIVSIQTSDGLGITDKENYKAATVVINGTSMPAQVKGRGNWTWNGFDKKPYRIKFDAKQAVLGMPKNKNWVLLAGADDYLGYLKNPVGFMLSRIIGLRWTPGLVPVELVINGNYQGLYFLTEHVRIGSNRVNITEQEDNETAPTAITGGWLVEIDNYPSEGNIVFQEGNGQWVMVSLREPEVLSSEQRSYLEGQIYGLNNALYGSSEEQLEALLDIDEAAKYYLVQEIMEDCESYHGSCMLYKDRDANGVADKWKFGPVWDFGNAYDRHQEKWIYVDPPFAQYWIGQLATWPAFQRRVQELWWVFYHEQKDVVRQQIIDFIAPLTEAAKRDAQVWEGTQNYKNNSDLIARRNDFLGRYDWRINWLYSQWGEGIKPSVEKVESGELGVESKKLIRDGQLYLMYKGTMYDVQGRKVDN